MPTGARITLQTVYRQVVASPDGRPKLFKHGRIISYGPDRQPAAPPPSHKSKYYKPAADDSDQ
ncbi:hypothetical protein J6590_058032 [Homalodisca vitripennis]|nr:hypothetical protein J6590_058032 [Homalodisca vitripennis]